MKTINETKKDSIWNWARYIVITYCFVFGVKSEYPILKWSLAVPTILIFLIFLLRKKTLSITVDNNIVIVKYNYGFLNLRLKTQEFTADEITNFTVSATAREEFYTIEISDGKEKNALMKFKDLKNRVIAIEILKDILESQDIKLKIYTNIYDPSSDFLKELILKKYSLNHNKFKSEIYFDGKKYLQKI